ncbi:NADH dehydrogenase [ubiquinone] 1 beta subcomplex subunit 5, mitochondrial isoform X1 [Nilaparvata lugens]|nr:NADH dehydrogenase [ubiquinone] 1 beta subcomplex subunit 5, mitochondrial isoform X2 [Nilaparvata lugens]XP_039277245.1 NADH dehydrogenase [ubiquinone] 1 beta subcomplex subunit 5, mitochondrial isoform X1 [Nilaparvata lugens]
MTIFSSLRQYPLAKSLSSLLNNRVVLKDAPKRFMGEHRVMPIVPSRFQYQKFKDLLHFYLAIGIIPVTLLITYVNVFIGPAQLTEIPEGYRPEPHEYYKHPITRFISKYLKTCHQQEYEKHMHWLYEADERAKIGVLTKKVLDLMRDRSDYQSFYYFPIDPRYARVVSEGKEEMEKYF